MAYIQKKIFSRKVLLGEKKDQNLIISDPVGEIIRWTNKLDIVGEKIYRSEQWFRKPYINAGGVSWVAKYFEAQLTALANSLV